MSARLVLCETHEALGEIDLDCPFCEIDLSGVKKCPCCGEPLFAYQEWRLRNDLTPGLLETEQPTDQAYVHAWCDDRLNTRVEAGDSE